METLNIGLGVYSLDRGSGLDMACYQQLEELARLGHNLDVYYIRKDTPDIGGVTYHHVAEYSRPYRTGKLLERYPLGKHDFFVAWGSPFYMLAPKIDNFVMVEFSIPPVRDAAFMWEAFVNLYIRQMTIWAARRSKIILAGSEYLYNKIAPYAKIKDNVFVFHSGIKFSNIGLSTPQSPPYAVFVGRHVPYKNVDHLVSLFRRVEKNVPGARLLTIGKSDYGQYPKLWHELKLTVGADYRGYVEDLWSVYGGASVYATCSLWEGEDRPALEAQSMGVPVVSYDNCSHPEVVHHGRRVHDDKAFVNAMTDYLTTPDISPFVGQYIREEYGVNHVVNKWLRQVREVI